MYKLKVKAKVFTPIGRSVVGFAGNNNKGIFFKKKYVCLYRYVYVYMCICMHKCMYMDIYIYQKHICWIGNDADN